MDILPYIQKSGKQGHFKPAITLYPNEGKSLNNNLKNRKLMIYDKSKQAEELKYLDYETAKFIKNATFTLFNIEYQMKYKREIDEEFAINHISLKNSFENAFNPLVAKTILLNRIQAYFKDIFLTSDDEETIKEKIKTYCKKHNKKGLEKITSLIGIALMAKTPDFKNVLLEFSDRNTVSKKLKELREINLTPIKPVEDFKEQVIRSIETNFIITLDYLKELDERLKCKGSYAETPHNIAFDNNFANFGVTYAKNP